MKLICTLFLSLLPAACVWAGTGEPSCSRKFDDQEIRDLTEKAIVEYSLAVDRPYRIEVNWSKCRYYVVIWRTDLPRRPIPRCFSRLMKMAWSSNDRACSAN